jgi:hypothetical protein
MMCSTVWSASCHVALPHHARSVVWRRLVGSPHNVAVSCEWSTRTKLHCSRMFARLTCHDGAAYPHVLQAIMAQVSGTLETREHSLETCEPSCIGRPAMPFFILEARDPLGTT